jgi:hypothetical protein
MRKIIVFISVCFLARGLYAQQLSQVTFASGKTFSSFAILTDQGVLVRITDEGNITEWGTEVQSLRSSNYYAPRLQPFTGRVDYYGDEADSLIRGKVKSIGTCTFTYYGAYETENRRGRLKTAGILSMDYYTRYDNIAFRGKLKSVGNYTVEYYSSFENESLRGKPKSINNTAITYYSSFDDKAVSGKVKSIGPFNYTWYTSYDRQGAGGAMKSGLQRQNINGITYILR